MRLLLLLLAAAATSAVAPSARAEGPSSPGSDQALLALAVGASTAIGPIAIGGAHAGRSNVPHSERDQGWIAAAAGFALAPLTAHLVTGEYGRGALFAAVPAATTLGLSALVVADRDAIYSGTEATRVCFVALFLTGATASAIGVIDAAFAPDRRAKERAASAPSLSLDVGPGSVALRGAW